jgi:hypothetical protein
MLKLLVGLLLVANIVLYASSAGYLGTGSTEGREPGRAAKTLDAQRIRFIDPTAVAAAGQNGAAVNASVAPVAATAASAEPTAAAAPPLQCIEVGNFDLAEARRFEQALVPLALGDRLSQRAVADGERYIVYIPPLVDKESADRKGAELRALGVTDFFVFSESSDLRFGISLGMFKSAEAANQHLANLGRKGVHSAKVAARPSANSKTAYQLRGLDAAAEATLTRIRAGFPKQETRDCPPG